MTEIKSPLVDDIPATLGVSGYVCVHNGVPHWPSARATLLDCLSANFGPFDDKRLAEVAEQGWRCVPIGGGPAAPERTDLIAAIRGIDTHLHAASLLTQQHPPGTSEMVQTKFTSIKTALRLAREIVTKLGVRQPWDDGREIKL
jgi:hypothetical protein